MSLFKKPKLERNIFKGLILKTAYLELDHNNTSNWGKQIDEYMSERFSFMSEGLHNVNFRAIDDDTGDAVGYVVWEENGVSMMIPIIVEDYKLKEPTLGKHKGKIVPLNEEYINMLRTSGGSEGEISTPDDDMNTNIEYLSQGGLFSVEDGYPKIAALEETVNRIREICKKGSLKISDEVDKHIKTAKHTNVRTDDEILAAKFAEIPNKPYHFIGDLLKKTASGKLYYEKIDILTAAEMKKIASLNSSYVNPWVSISVDKNIKNVPIVKQLKDTGISKRVLMDGVAMECSVINNLMPIWESKSSLKTLSISQRIYEPQANPEPHVQTDETIDHGKWAYGDIFGEKISRPIKPYRKDQQIWIDNLIPVEDSQDAVNNIIILHLGENITAPYEVLNAQNIKMGPKGEETESYRLESLTNGTRAVIWLHQSAAKILKASKDKLKSYGYTIWGDDDVYIIPATCKMFKLSPNARVESTNVRGEYEKYVQKIAAEYNSKMEIIHHDFDNFSLNIRGDVNRHYSGLNKAAALLMANHYTGEVRDDIKEYDMFMEYSIKKEAEEKKDDNKVIDLTPLDKYQGEWIKVAALLATIRPILKKANLEDVVNDLVGAEYVDDSNVADMGQLITSLTDLLSKIGELLLLARLSKVDLPEAILAKAFKALTELLVGLRGKNEYSD